MAPCPICGRPAATRADGAAFPFCSARCKSVDLGQWLNESYRVAADAPLDESEAEAGPNGPSRGAGSEPNTQEEAEP